MVERMCRSCGAGNDPEAGRCQACGAAFEHGAPAALARRSAGGALAARLRKLPALPALSSPAGKSVALGLAALAVEVGASLLQRAKRDEPATTALARIARAPAGRRARSVMRQRVWEEFDADGRLRRRVIEHLITREDSSQ